MQFLSIREFSKAPGTALSKLAQDGKAVLTNNGKPAAIMLTVSAESFEKVFSLLQEIEKRSPAAVINQSSASDKERLAAFERLVKFNRKKVNQNFDYRQELMEALDERFDRADRH